MMERFTAAVASRDVEALVAFYADDATVMPPGRPPLRGRESIRQYWQHMLGSGMAGASQTLHAVEGSGDLAYELGEWRGVVPSPDGKVVEVTAKYVTVWRWDAGAPRIVVDSFSRNA